PGLAMKGAPAQPAGLPEGTVIPSFRLPDLMGRMVALEDFRGQRVLLVHWSPKCGFCDLIAPDLAGRQTDLRKRNVELLLVSYGDVESNSTLAEEHGLECPILLQQESQTVEVFQRLGTPVAYLLDERGQVAQPIAVGAERVPALARDVATDRPE